jgi:hypothetical protein
MRFLGWAVIVLTVMGGIGLIDFHVCIKGAGECQCIKEK